MTPTTKVSEINVEQLRGIITEVSTEVIQKQFPILLDYAMRHHYLPAIEEMIDRKLEPIHEELHVIKTRLDIVEVRLDGIDIQLKGLDKRLSRVEHTLEVYEKKMDFHLVHHEELEKSMVLRQGSQRKSVTISDAVEKDY
jgi:carbonic anhydrase